MIKTYKNRLQFCKHLKTLPDEDARRFCSDALKSDNKSLTLLNKFNYQYQYLLKTQPIFGGEPNTFDKIKHIRDINEKLDIIINHATNNPDSRTAKALHRTVFQNQLYSLLTDKTQTSSETFKTKYHELRYDCLLAFSFTLFGQKYSFAPFRTDFTKEIDETRNRSKKLDIIVDHVLENPGSRSEQAFNEMIKEGESLTL